MPGRGARRGHLVDHGVLLVALAVLAGGHAVLLSGSWWWITVVGVTATVLTVTCALRMIAVRGAALTGLVAGVLVLAWVFVPGSMVLGLVPTPETVASLGDLLDRARTVVAEEAPPVEADAPITLVVAAAFAVVALVSDLLLQRRGGVLVIGLLLAVLYLVPAVVVEEVPSFVVLVVPAASWLLLLHRSTRPERQHGEGTGSAPVLGPATVAVGTGALVLAFVLAPVLPDTSALTGTADELEAGPFGQGINPMLRLGDDLRSPSRGVALEYTTEGEPPYLSVAMLRDFTGDTWEPVAGDAPSPREGRADLAGEVVVDRRVVEVEVRQLRTTLLPVPYPAVDVRGLDGEWERVNAGLTLRSDSSDTRNQTYAVTSLVRQPTARQLAEAPEDYSERLDPYLELPADLPRSIVDTAQVVAGNEVGAYAKAQALQDFFRSGAFEYSETAPVEGDYDGNGVGVIERFLEERSGYCVHYSSAMAVMARSVGVPARIMVGYAPGVRAQPGPTTSDSEERYRVTTDQLHAWPQVYVEGVGWVEFEPTPGITDSEEDPGQGSATTAPTTTGPTPQPEVTTAAPRPEALDDGSTARAQAEDGRSRRDVVLGAVVVLLLLGAAPAVARLVTRRRRLRRSASPNDWWREVVATAEDLGVVADTSTTIATHTAALAAHVRPEAQESLTRLRSVLEQRRYGPRQGGLRERESTTRDDAVTVVRDLLASAPRGRRRRARLLPASLLRWR